MLAITITAYTKTKSFCSATSNQNGTVLRRFRAKLDPDFLQIQSRGRTREYDELTGYDGQQQ